ncbi:hypothetical protein NECID01_2175 [Nematocida sp. AWRm77]|nr:hypothetical protein NECID01_2175 [Nematocida sp. AWRm77]
MLRGPVEESAVHSPILRMAYRGCMHRLKGLPFLPASLSVREEFLAAAGIAEAELFALETCWPLSSVCEISLPGKTMSATVCKTYPECTVQLENRMFAALSLPGPGGRGLFDVGQAMQVQVQSVDLAQQRVVVLPTEKSGERTLRALSDGRVKQVSAAGALRLLKEKPLGAYVLRLSATHKDSLVLTLRMTDYPDECICAHLRVKECADGYELCGAMYATLASVVSSFVPAYTKVLQRVHTHQRFSMCALEEIKEAAARRAVPCAFSVSRTAHGCISFVHASADPSSSPEEVLFFVTDRGLVHGGKIFPTPESVCAAYKISPA